MSLKESTDESGIDEVELGDYSEFKLVPLTTEKRSQIHLVRQRTARKIKFVDESGESLDQTFYSNNLDYDMNKKGCCTIL